MKRTISMILVILMLLPILASYAFAVSPEDVVITDEPKNIAGVGTFETESQYNWDSWRPEYLVDGDRETGTYSPRGASTDFALDLGKEFYVSEIVFVFNGKGELPYEEETIDEVLKDTKSIQIIAYDKDGVETYKSELWNVSDLTEFTAEVNDDVQMVYIKELPTNQDYCALWELEVYAVNPPPRCTSEGENIASQALLNSTYYDATKKENVTSTWWAMDLKKMIDGDVNTGTQTVKSANFSIWMYFGQEHYFSDVVVHCNGRGYLSSGDITEGFIDPETEQPAMNEEDELTGPIVYKSYLLTIVMYNFNDEVVYESEVADVSGLTEFVADVGVSAATIELKVSNAGNDGYGGSIYFWDVEANEGTGEHLYEEIDIENPACGVDGYRLFECQDPKCGARKTQIIESTGFHVWDEGEVTLEPTADEHGVKTLTCTVCSDKIEREVPATGHNWVVDEVVEPYCEVGYTKYKCADDGCELTYCDNYTTDITLGHKYDNGVTTKKATTTEEGEMVYTCQRNGCGHKKVKVLRKAKYFDNTFKIDNSIITKYEGYQTVDKTNATDAYTVLGKYVFDGVTDLGMHGLNEPTNYWFSPGNRTVEIKKDENGEPILDAKGNTIPIKDENGNTIEHRESGFLYIYFDKEYYFTKGTIYAAANYRWFEVHFQYQDEKGDWVTSATYKHDRFNIMTVSALDMTTALNFGARASRIVIESVNGDCGWTYGQVPEESPNHGGRLQIHEIELEAHECVFTAEDYEDESKWIQPTCATNGSCKAKCAVCGQESLIVLDSLTYGHNYGEVEVLEEPTCSEVGIGTKKCSVCNYKVEVDVPATGEHTYTSDYEYVSPNCSKDGIGQRVCKYCNAADYNYPIPATGNHIYEYITKSAPNYTAVGKTIHACIYCEKSGGGADIIEDKLELPKDFVTFTGYSLRMTDYVGIRASFKFDQEILDILEQTCDVTITIKAKNLTTGKVVSAQAYGKQVYYSGTEKFNDNNEFSAVAKVANCSSEYAFSYEVKLVNFRGTLVEEYSVPVLTSGKTGVTVKEIASDILANYTSIKETTKNFLQELVSEH